MDDFLVYESSFSDCLKLLENILERHVKSNMVVNWEKCHFMEKEGIVLKHLVFVTGIEVE